MTGDSQFSGRFLRVAKAFGILFAMGLGLSCTDKPIGGYLLSQPFIKDSLNISGRVIDTAGHGLAGVSVSLDYLLLNAGDTAPPHAKPRVTGGTEQGLYYVTYVVEIYNMFDELIRTISSSATCDQTTCTGALPAWDGLDESRVASSAGLYYYNITTYNSGNWAELGKSGPTWLTRSGYIGTSDAEGFFTIPPIPQKQIEFDLSSGGVSSFKYYKGWVFLTFEKNQVLLGRDTVCLFGNGKTFDFHPH